MSDSPNLRSSARSAGFNVSLIIIQPLQSITPDGFNYRTLLIQRNPTQRSFSAAHVFPGMNHIEATSNLMITSSSHRSTVQLLKTHLAHLPTFKPHLRSVRFGKHSKKLVFSLGFRRVYTLQARFWRISGRNLKNEPLNSTASLSTFKLMFPRPRKPRTKCSHLMGYPIMQIS
ncbi:hypothetical protein VP01_1493g4 [Puccinia sorghi]|uniref:Uncharacterized protein n=1 Tax=Puccinia sorghi TaxID=27349 RepID=A0A0L6VL68_9BASI|nr:hypothetical protein VP01_1493g4 [Puccinia sorghi]